MEDVDEVVDDDDEVVGLDWAVVEVSGLVELEIGHRAEARVVLSKLHSVVVYSVTPAHNA